MLKLWKNTRGQDFVEIALVAGFIAVAAGAAIPSLSVSVSKTFSKTFSGIASSMTSAAAAS